MRQSASLFTVRWILRDVLRYLVHKASQELFSLKEPGTLSGSQGLNRRSWFRINAKMHSLPIFKIVFSSLWLFRSFLLRLLKNQKLLTYFHLCLSFFHSSEKGELWTDQIMSTKKSFFQWSSLKTLWAKLSSP